MNIFTLGSTDLYSTLMLQLKPYALIESNFEQVIAMAKLKQIDKLCIFMDVYHCSNHFNSMRGQTAAEKIHEIDPLIPILIWDGRQFEVDKEYENLPSALQVTGKVIPIKNPNELYLSFDFYQEDIIFEVTTKFFKGELTSEDVLKKECLKFEFKQ